MLYFLFFIVAGIYYLPWGIYLGWKILQYMVWANFGFWIEHYRDLYNIIKEHHERLEANNRRRI